MQDSLAEALAVWLWPGLSALVAVAVAHVAYRVMLAVVRRVTHPEAVARIFLDAAARALGVALALLALHLGLSAAPEELPGIAVVQRIVTLLMILSLTWAAVRCSSAIGEVIVTMNPTLRHDWRYARKVETQTRVLIRGLNILIVIVGVGAALMTIRPVQQLGTSLLASAGVGGIILGFAARPVLSNLLAGVQIALTQPFRIGDVLRVQEEWCWVEEVTATYVVLRVWDLRRLIVPLQWFIDNPFQNWSRNNTEMMGTVMIWVDYKVPMQPLRDEFARLLRASSLWDGVTESVQTVESGERSQQLRFLMSATDSSILWDLRCEIREGLIAFLQARYPEYLPRLRGELLGSGAES
jgi:small-conductance mechanosensitive channel